MTEFFEKAGIDIGILVLLLMVLVLIMTVILINLSLNLNRLNRRYHSFMKGSDGQSLERVFARKLKEIDRIANASDNNSEQILKIKKKMSKTLSKYGVVKYDAFDDVGGKMSFALAMLDEKNTGFILNAIHSRDNCFFYIKEIVKGESYTLLSSEETDALRKAVSFDDEKE